MFLVDTGADASVIMPTDARLIGVDFSHVTSSGNQCFGIGGEVECLAEDAIIGFDAADRTYSYVIALDMFKPTPGCDDLPSVLGRDILDKWRMEYDPSRGHLRFLVRKADEVKSRVRS